MQKPSSARSEFIVGGKYKLLRKIGSGSFGDIYQGVNITNGEVCVAQYWFGFIMLARCPNMILILYLFIKVKFNTPFTFHLYFSSKVFKVQTLK